MSGWTEGLAIVWCILLIYVLLINVVAFAMYGIDKRRANKNKWRISEKTLLIVTAMGGSVGALFGMKKFRHKTKKWKFKILVPLFFILHIGLVLFGIWSGLK